MKELKKLCPQWIFETNIHQNKDWNHEVDILSKFDEDFETNIHQNKDWNTDRFEALYFCIALWDQHPSEQGLKQ